VADKTPDPAGATTASFASVSCPSTTSCMAVGAYDTGVQPTTLTYAFAERWNGSVWSIERVPSVAGEMTALSGVSCVSVSDCIAVGSEAPDGLGGETQPLAASWNGKAWSLETIPMPAGSSAASLAGVSCSSAEVCTAVGYVISAGGRQAALVETLASGTWAPQLAPLPTGANLSWLDSVSCPSATACTAVGAWAVSTIDVQALAEEWNGTAWTVEPVPQAYPSDQSELYGIACSAATACVAVGRALPFPTPPDGLTIGDAWDGSAWSVSPTLDTARAVGDDLHGVACAAGGTCTAVGRVINSDGIVSLIEQS
jgi:hypothetical protein